MPDLRICPDHESFVKPRVCNDAITIGALIDRCYGLLPNHYDYEIRVKLNPIEDHEVTIYHRPTSRFRSIHIMPPIVPIYADHMVEHIGRVLQTSEEGTINDVF